MAVPLTDPSPTDYSRACPSPFCTSCTEHGEYCTPETCENQPVIIKPMCSSRYGAKGMTASHSEACVSDVDVVYDLSQLQSSYVSAYNAAAIAAYLDKVVLHPLTRLFSHCDPRPTSVPVFLPLLLPLFTQWIACITLTHVSPYSPCPSCFPASCAACCGYSKWSQVDSTDKVKKSAIIAAGWTECCSSTHSRGSQ